MHATVIVDLHTFLDKVADELLGHRGHRDGGGLLQHPPALPALEAAHQRRSRPVQDKLSARDRKQQSTPKKKRCYNNRQSLALP